MKRRRNRARHNRKRFRYLETLETRIVLDGPELGDIQTHRPASLTLDLPSTPIAPFIGPVIPSDWSPDQSTEVLTVYGTNLEYLYSIAFDSSNTGDAVQSLFDNSIVQISEAPLHVVIVDVETLSALGSPSGFASSDAPASDTLGAESDALADLNPTAEEPDDSAGRSRDADVQRVARNLSPEADQVDRSNFPTDQSSSRSSGDFSQHSSDQNSGAEYFGLEDESASRGPVASGDGEEVLAVTQAGDPITLKSTDDQAIEIDDPARIALAESASDADPPSTSVESTTEADRQENLFALLASEGKKAGHGNIEVIVSATGEAGSGRATVAITAEQYFAQAASPRNQVAWSPHTQASQQRERLSQLDAVLSRWSKSEMDSEASRGALDELPVDQQGASLDANGLESVNDYLNRIALEKTRWITNEQVRDILFEKSEVIGVFLGLSLFSAHLLADRQSQDRQKRRVVAFLKRQLFS